MSGNHFGYSNMPLRKGEFDDRYKHVVIRESAGQSQCQQWKTLGTAGGEKGEAAERGLDGIKVDGAVVVSIPFSQPLSVQGLLGRDRPVAAVSRGYEAASSAAITLQVKD